MAKIKVKGYQEMIEVSNEKAKKIKALFLDTYTGDDHKIDTGNTVIKKKDIVAVFLDSEKIEDDSHKKKLEEYYKKRDALIALSPSERAKLSAWGHYKLFYYGVYKKNPDESRYNKEAVQAHAARFYEKNPQWAKPSILIWFDFLNLDPNLTRIDESVLRILERVELSEIDDSKQSIEFEAKKQNQEKTTEEVGDRISEIMSKNLPSFDYEAEGIKVEDLPF